MEKRSITNTEHPTGRVFEPSMRTKKMASEGDEVREERN